MDVLDVIMNRRTIRKFKSKPVPEELVLKIVEAGQRAPTACSLQTYTIIWVKAEAKRKALCEACGKQQFILEAPVTLTICADVRKLIDIAKIGGNATSLERGFGYAIKLFAIIDAALSHTRPILLTSITTVGGLLPLALNGGLLWSPMAYTIMFGLIFSTVLTLGLVPVLYSLFFKVRI